VANDDIKMALSALSFLKATPVEMQGIALENVFKMAAPKFLGMNSEQVDIITNIFRNPDVLSESGIPDETILNEAFEQFRSASTPAAPIRIICSHCKTLRRLDL